MHPGDQIAFDRAEEANEVACATSVPAYLDFLKRELGDHLIEIKQRKNAEGIHIRPLISPAFKVARILSNLTGNTVSPENLPLLVDEETVDQCRWAVNNEPWVTGLKENDTPVNYFFDNRDNIIEEMQRGDGKKEESASPMNPPIQAQVDDEDLL